jgi:hypothetical protein
LCKTCEDFETCTECTTNASGPPCQCDPGFFDDGPTCIACDPRCLSCTSTDNFSCTECADDSYLQFDSTVCLRRCPTGFTLNELTRECEGPVDLVFCINFDNLF